MNLNDAATAINAATAILSESNEEARLVERVRQLKDASALTTAGTSARHCANLRLIDAIAALDGFRARRRDPQGFEIGFRS